MQGIFFGKNEYGGGCFSLGCSDQGKLCSLSLTDIDGLDSSAIGGQLMASASTESPFAQGRRIDDSTVAGKGLGVYECTYITCNTRN